MNLALKIKNASISKFPRTYIELVFYGLTIDNLNCLSTTECPSNDGMNPKFTHGDTINCGVINTNINSHLKFIDSTSCISNTIQSETPTFHAPGTQPYIVIDPTLSHPFREVSRTPELVKLPLKLRI